MRGPLAAFFKLSSKLKVFRYSQKQQLKYISCGVPQESGLGPLLFIMCINDFSELLKTFNTALYANSQLPNVDK